MGVKATVTFENAVRTRPRRGPHRSTRTSRRYRLQYRTTAMASAAAVTATPTEKQSTPGSWPASDVLGQQLGPVRACVQATAARHWKMSKLVGLRSVVVSKNSSTLQPLRA